MPNPEQTLIFLPESRDNSTQPKNSLPCDEERFVLKPSNQSSPEEELLKIRTDLAQECSPTISVETTEVGNEATYPPERKNLIQLIQLSLNKNPTDARQHFEAVFLASFGHHIFSTVQ